MSPSWLKSALVIVGLSLVPVYAFAGPAASQALAADDDSVFVAKGKGKDKDADFPMASAKFMERVEKRIAKTKERVTARLDKRNVPADKRKAILADLDAGATKVRAAAVDAGKDGTVTADEAKTVRALAKDLRADAREKYGKGKNGGKGKRGKKGQKV